jgi:hypothetical protein
MVDPFASAPHPPPGPGIVNIQYKILQLILRLFTPNCYFEKKSCHRASKLLRFVSWSNSIFFIGGITPSPSTVSFAQLTPVQLPFSAYLAHAGTQVHKNIF